MRSWAVTIVSIALIVICVLLLGCSKSKPPNQDVNVYYAKVEWIHDGDTVTVIDLQNVKHKLRLYAIDAPELAQSSGKESMKNLIRILPKQKTVRVEVENKDRYGREVSTIYLGEVNINRQQIAEGWAWHYKQYDKKFYNDYDKLEKSAKNQRLGLWHYPNAKEPWEYRKSNREKAKKSK